MTAGPFRRDCTLYQRQMAGGGFFPDNDSQGASSPAKGKNFSNVQGLRSLTIKQLCECDVNADGRPVIGGQEISQFSIVGCIRSVKDTSTGTEYIIEDGTSGISAKCWVDKHIEPVAEGSWVRVYGSLKALANNKSVTVSALRKIVDYNEVTFHFLEAMSTHLFLTKPSLFQQTGSGSVKQAKVDTYYSDDQNLTPLQRAVYDVYRTSNDEIGIHISSVIRSLKTRYSESEVKTSVSSLISEGLLYLTIDSDHARHVSA